MPRKTGAAGTRGKTANMNSKPKARCWIGTNTFRRRAGRPEFFQGTENDRLVCPGAARHGIAKCLAELNTFSVITTGTAANNYLAWCNQSEPQFDLIREALKRPYARMDGDYSKPYELPIPNFVTVRASRRCSRRGQMRFAARPAGQGFAGIDVDARYVPFAGGRADGQPGFNLAERDWPHGWKGYQAVPTGSFSRAEAVPRCVSENCLKPKKIDLLNPSPMCNNSSP